MPKPLHSERGSEGNFIDNERAVSALLGANRARLGKCCGTSLAQSGGIRIGPMSYVRVTVRQGCGGTVPRSLPNVTKLAWVHVTRHYQFAYSRYTSV